MPAYLRESISSFLALSDSEVLAKLTNANADARFPLTPDAIHAWNAQLLPLRSGLTYLTDSIQDSAGWHLLLEYPIPQIGKRIDAVILAHDSVIVVETKTGNSTTSAQRQVEDYAIALACFHEASAKRPITPIVLSEARTSASSETSQYERLVRPCKVSVAADFGKTLVETCLATINRNAVAIDPSTWDEARFRPIPPIIDAAVKLYAGMDVFEIGHAASAREELQRTTSAVLRIVEHARERRSKAICFVTGVPGAGKTLVGLNAVHHTSLKDVSMFLSGNGPLVKIIREALVRDVVKREGVSRRTAENTLHAFVANVHRFADEYSSKIKVPPARNVIIFDEAQRAWDKEQNTKPSRSGRGVSRPDSSEPHMLLEIMNRRSDWAVIVALVGGGQEINRGEAGIAEWGRTIAAFRNWDVFASSEVIRGEVKANGFCLFEVADVHPERIHCCNELHLAVSNRSVRAQAISEWVDLVLQGDSRGAAAVAEHLNEPPYITRKLNRAKQWLNSRRIGLTRAGLVSSASASRLRGDGLEPSFDFHRFFEWEHWFLSRHVCEEVGCDHEYCCDTRASSKLEVSATQFEIQGLELDWIGMCWGEDLVFVDGKWRSQRFNNKTWKLVDPSKLSTKSRPKAEVRHTYRLNAYRVLLTRARQGMVVYLPDPPLDDLSRSHSYLDSTYEFLTNCGAVLLD